LKLGNSIITASFVSRPNRFTVLAKQDGKTLLCYCPNPGRLKELLNPNASVALNHCPSPTRKTNHDLVAISTERRWVSIDSRIPNMIVKEALMECKLQEFRSYLEVIPESVFGDSRIDFLLESKNG
jgi:sugar fermentation stimulation protein A